MRKIFFILLLLLPFSLSAQDSPVEQTWQEANSAYSEGDYSRARQLYNSILEQGVHSSQIYFNIGNSYYKQDSVAQAIAAYIKAEKLDPSNENIIQNLAHAEALTKNRINALPEFFVTRWVRSLEASAGSNGWAIIAIVSFGIALLSVMLYLLTSKVVLRKVGFSSAIALLVITALSLNFSFSQKKELTASGDAVVLSSAVAVKGSPDNGAKELFILNEGARVKITEKIGSWCEIKLASGNSGWVELHTLVEVD